MRMKVVHKSAVRVTGNETSKLSTIEYPDPYATWNEGRLARIGPPILALIPSEILEYVFKLLRNEWYASCKYGIETGGVRLRAHVMSWISVTYVCRRWRQVRSLSKVFAGV